MNKKLDKRSILEMAMGAMSWKDEAVKKLLAKGGTYGRYANAMKDAVRDKLEFFCGQDDEFAQAVAQGGSFEDCMKAVEKEVKNNAVEDLAAYQAAVSFYFPGAKIECRMTIDLIGEDAGKKIHLDLNDFL